MNIFQNVSRSSRPIILALALKRLFLNVLNLKNLGEKKNILKSDFSILCAVLILGT